jgi:hypothetical protein
MDMRKRPYRGGRGLLLAAAISGAVTAYFADPARGKERRDRAIDRLRGAFTVAADRTQEWRRRVAARAWSKPPQMTSIAIEPQTAAARTPTNPAEG